MSEILEFRYEMRSDFDRAIARHSFKLMCCPADGPDQRVLDLNCEIEPCSWMARGADGFGNIYLYGLAAEPHEHFLARVTGAVEVLPGGAAEEGDGLAEFVRQPTPLTAPGESALRYRREAPPPRGLDALGVALHYMERLHRDINYQRGVSDTTTGSDLVFARRSGVCQDFAHALITLCRLEGIPARYVAGMLPGEGETHAWVEVLAGGTWRGLDPTQGRAVDGGRIRLARGRDCRDCLVNRGIYFNPAVETQKISVNVSVRA